MEVRCANINDVDGIMSLLYQVAEVHHNGRPDLFKGGCSKYTVEQLKNIISDKQTPVFVAVEDGKVMGHAFCVVTTTDTNGVLVPHKTLYVDDICVDENCRGKRIGTELCNRVKRYAKENGCYNVTLNVWCLNKPAMSFYKAMGFSEQKIVMETLVDAD